jgi:hypothetical protein
MNSENSVQALRRGDWRAAAAWAGAIALTACAVWLAQRTVHADAPAARVSWSAEQQSLASDIERYALNGLLVPLIDHEAWPMRWADPWLAMHCDSGTDVQVDGQPLEPGTPITGRTFVVAWRLQSCLPFGFGGPELTGQAELRVSRQMDGLAATVSLTDLRVQRQGNSVVVNKVFFAHLR